MFSRNNNKVLFQKSRIICFVDNIVFEFPNCKTFSKKMVYKFFLLKQNENICVKNIFDS